MTAREWMQINHPDEVCEEYAGGVARCPGSYPDLGLPETAGDCPFKEANVDYRCTACWNREIPETNGCAQSLECCGISDEDESRLSPDGVEGSSIDYTAELERLQDIIQEQREKIRRLDGLIRSKNKLIDALREDIAKYDVMVRTVEAMTGKKIMYN